MTLERRLRIVLVIVGIVFVVGVYPLINLCRPDFDGCRTSTSTSR
jgi:hypothetical protein